MEPQMLMDSAKKAITPVTAGIFAMVSLCVVGVELVVWAIYRHHSVLPLVFLGASRIVEGAVMVCAAFAGQDRLWILDLSGKTIFAGMGRGLLWTAGFAMVLPVVYAALFISGIDPSGFIKTALPAKNQPLAPVFPCGRYPVAHNGGALFQRISLRFPEAVGNVTGGCGQFTGICDCPRGVCRIFSGPGYRGDCSCLLL